MQDAARWYTRLLAISVPLCFVLVFVGAFVRLSDAGLGCPDWPGCYGRLVAPVAEDAVRQVETLFQTSIDVGKAWKEMAHRYIASILGFLVLALTLIALFRREARLPVKTTVALAVLVIFQALLGMWTVTLLLKPLVVTAHLLGGMATLALLLWLWMGQQPTRPEPAPPRLRLWAGLALAAVTLQIFLGGWVSTNYAALACVDFPTCHGQFWPGEDMDFSEAFVLWHGLGQNYEFGILDHPARTAIHVTHRLGALLLSVVLLGLVIWLLRAGQGVFRGMAVLIAAALALQIAIGTGIVVKHLPLWLATAHNAGAALLLMSVVALNHLAWRAPRP